MAVQSRLGRLSCCTFVACALLPHACPSQTSAPSEGDGSTKTVAAEPAAAVTSKRISQHDRDRAQRRYREALADLRARRLENAAGKLDQAIHLDPSRPEFYQALAVTQDSRVSGLLHTAAEQREHNAAAADRLLAEVRGIDASNPRFVQHEAASLAKRPLAPTRFVPASTIQLRPNNTLHSFHETVDVRSLAGEMGRLYGLRVSFDPDLPSKSVRIDLDDADSTTALRVLNLLADTFVTPLDEHTMLLATDNTANRNRLEHLLEEVIPLPGYSVEQINEAANLVRTVFELKQVSVAAQAGAIAVRAPEDVMHAIDLVLADLLDSGSEVVLEAKLYSVDTQKVRNLGIVLPTSFTFFSVAAEVQNIIANNSSVIQQLIASGVLASTASPAEIALYLLFVGGLSSTTNLQNTFFIFGGGLSGLANGTASGLNITPIGIAASSFPSLNFALNNSEARVLDDVQLRVSDRATGTFKAGFRYPIQSSIYSSSTTSASSNSTVAALLARYLGTSTSLANSSVIPQFQYEDLGLVVTATPRVLANHEVSLKLEIKLSSLSGTALNGIPILASRQFSSTMTMEDGQTAVMASQVQDSEAAVITGVPGLNDIPGLQGGTNRETTKAHTNLVLLLTPHIVRRSHDEIRGPYVPLAPRPDDN